VAAAVREPQRLFNLLDMLDAVVREQERLDELFSSESATLVAIREHTCEVERALQPACSSSLVSASRLSTSPAPALTPGTCPRSCGTP